jgi:luciferase-like monooxygenase
MDSGSKARRASVDVGLGLWSMRSPVAEDATFEQFYDDLITDGQLAEHLGFHSLWVAEHHFSSDGWCPAPLVAAAAVLGATNTLHVGTGIHLLPLYDPIRALAEVNYDAWRAAVQPAADAEQISYITGSDGAARAI